TSTEPGRVRVNGDIDVDRVGVQSLEFRGSEIECISRRLGDRGIEGRIDRQRVGWATQRQRRRPRKQQGSRGWSSRDWGSASPPPAHSDPSPYPSNAENLMPLPNFTPFQTVEIVR